MPINATKHIRHFPRFLLCFLLFIGLFEESLATKSGNWLTVKLLNTDESFASKQLIVSLKVRDSWQTKKIECSASSHQEVIEADFDLGKIEQVDILKITWPSNEEQILNRVAVNQVLALEKPEFPAPPSNVFARVVGQEQIDLIWKDNSDNELGFSIERSQHADRGFREVGKVSANKNVYTDNSVEKNTTYYYRIRAISENGRSIFDGAYQKTEKNTGLVLEDVSQPLRMYPNPNKDFLDVRVNNDIMGDVIVKFLDEKGKELKSMRFRKSITDLKRKVDISTLPFGVYMVEVSLIGYRSLFKNS